MCIIIIIIITLSISLYYLHHLLYFTVTISRSLTFYLSLSNHLSLSLSPCSKCYFNRFCSRNLVHAIETVVIDWTHQIREVLKKDSAQPLLEGLNPNPYVELEFWKAKCNSLECIYDQVRRPIFIYIFLITILSFFKIKIYFISSCICRLFVHCNLPCLTHI